MESYAVAARKKEEQWISEKAKVDNAKQLELNEENAQRCEGLGCLLFFSHFCLFRSAAVKLAVEEAKGRKRAEELRREEQARADAAAAEEIHQHKRLVQGEEQ